jgi:hypothetical protein
MNFEIISFSGVSFPANNTRPTIIIDFGKFQMIFYSNDGNRINQDIDILDELEKESIKMSHIFNEKND